VADGTLRQDLYYGLCAFPCTCRHLRERVDDITLLARHFMDEMAARTGVYKRLAPAALEQLAGYPWPGNVRELRNAQQRACVMET
jgi:DNA-binding NtrC family response regulator